MLLCITKYYISLRIKFHIIIGPTFLHTSLLGRTLRSVRRLLRPSVSISMPYFIEFSSLLGIGVYLNCKWLPTLEDEKVVVEQRKLAVLTSRGILI